MNFECPTCKKSGQVDDSKVPESGVYATCPQCSNKFLIKREAPKDFEFEPVEKSIPNAATVARPASLTQLAHPEDSFRPWVRFWARSIDVFFIGIIATIAGYVVTTSFEIDNIFVEIFVSFFLINIAFLIYESTLICGFATTIGKSILGIKVVNKDGAKLGFSTSIARCFSILKASAFFLVFPALTMFLVYKEIKRIKQSGIASWDIDSNTEVISNPIGGIRQVFGICLGTIALISVSIIHLATKIETKRIVKQQAFDAISSTTPVSKSETDSPPAPPNAFIDPFDGKYHPISEGGKVTTPDYSKLSNDELDSRIAAEKPHSFVPYYGDVVAEKPHSFVPYYGDVVDTPPEPPPAPPE